MPQYECKKTWLFIFIGRNTIIRPRFMRIFFCWKSFWSCPGTISLVHVLCRFCARGPFIAKGIQWHIVVYLSMQKSICKNEITCISDTVCLVLALAPSCAAPHFDASIWCSQNPIWPENAIERHVFFFQILIMNYQLSSILNYML